MSPLWILLTGVVIVVGGVLILRLHAFLALLLAAIVVALLTPQTAIVQHEIKQHAVRITLATPEDNHVPTVPYLELGQSGAEQEGTRYHVLRPDPDTGRLDEMAVLRVGPSDSVDDSGRQTTRFPTTPIGDDPPVAVRDTDLAVSWNDYQSARTTAQLTVGERVADRFGATCTKIAILIALAAIIGKCLLESGAADRIVRSALKVVGERGAPLAFLGSGFLLAIPVFFDTVFYLMIPLGKAMGMRTGRNYLLYVLTIVAGATMAHSLVPPTPGPLFVAEQLGIDLGLMIIAGCAVGLFSSMAGFLFAATISRYNELPLRESPDMSLSDLEELSRRDESELPPLAVSLLPILLPVLCIAGWASIQSFSISLPDNVNRVASTVGNKNIALAIGAAIAMVTLVWQKRTSLKALAASIQSALASGGVIILITAGGGAFGGMLQQTGIANLISGLEQGSHLLLVALAFFVTMAIRTAQGSATVAMITAVGILSGLTVGGELGCHPLYIALAIGCGSKPIAWMNDSGFWVICKMSGMTEAEGLKYITPMSVLMGFVGLLVTLLGAWLLPLR